MAPSSWGVLTMLAVALGNASATHMKRKIGKSVLREVLTSVTNRTVWKSHRIASLISKIRLFESQCI